MMNEPKRMVYLRFFLVFSGIAWAASLVGVVVSWKKALELLNGLGLSSELPHDPMLDYWLRMAAGAFGLVGLIFFVFAARPIKHKETIPLFGWLMIVEGIILLTHGIRLHLPPWPFYADTAACFVGGVGILGFQGKRE